MLSEGRDPIRGSAALKCTPTYGKKNIRSKGSFCNQIELKHLVTGTWVTGVVINTTLHYY